MFKKRCVIKTHGLFKDYLKHAIYSTSAFRFELVYMRTIKKLFRKKFIKKRNLYSYTRFWVTVKPNFLLTTKSKNSRMGSGVGSYVRVCARVFNNKPLIFFNYYPVAIIKQCIRYFKKKLNLTLLLK